MPRARSGRRLASVASARRSHVQQDHRWIRRERPSRRRACSGQAARRRDRCLAHGCHRAAVRPRSGVVATSTSRTSTPRLTEKLEQAARSTGAEAEIVDHELPCAWAARLRGAGRRRPRSCSAPPRMARPARSSPAASRISLLHGSPCSVAVAPHGLRRTGPPDGLAGSRSATTARPRRRSPGRRHRPRPRRDAPVKLVAVAEPSPVVIGKGAGAGQGRPSSTTASTSMMRERLDEALRSAPDDVRVEGTLVDGPPAESLEQIGVEDGGVLVARARGHTARCGASCSARSRPSSCARLPAP